MDTPRGEGFINSMSDSEFLLIIPCGTRNWAGGMRELGLIKPLQRGGDAWNEKYTHRSISPGFCAFLWPVKGIFDSYLSAVVIDTRSPLGGAYRRSASPPVAKQVRSLRKALSYH